MRREYVLCNTIPVFNINPLGLHPDGDSLLIYNYEDQRLQPVNSPTNGFFIRTVYNNPDQDEQIIPYEITTKSGVLSGNITLRHSNIKPGLKLCIIGDDYISRGWVTGAIKNYDSNVSLYGVMDGDISGNQYTGLIGWNARNVLEEEEYNNYQNPMFHNGKFDFKNFANELQMPPDTIVVLSFGLNALRQGDSPQKALTYYLKLKKEVEKIGYSTYIVTPVTTAEIGMNYKLSKFAELMRKTVRSGLVDISWLLPPNLSTTNKTTDNNFGPTTPLVTDTSMCMPNQTGHELFGTVLYQHLIYDSERMLNSEL